MSALQINFEVIRPVRIEHAGSFLVENVWKVVVLFWDGAEVYGCIGGHGVGLCSHLREGKLEEFSAVHPKDASKCSHTDEGDFQCFKLRSYFTGIRDWCCQQGETCKGREVSDELIACRVVSNEILLNTQSINRL